MRSHLRCSNSRMTGPGRPDRVAPGTHRRPGFRKVPRRPHAPLAGGVPARLRLDTTRPKNLDCSACAVHGVASSHLDAVPSARAIQQNSAEFSCFRGFACAHIEPARPSRTAATEEQNRRACVEGVSAETRRVHARVHDHAEKAQLGPPQGGPRAAHQWNRSYCLYPWRGPQPAGALDRAHPRGPCEGSSRRALPHRTGHVGRQRGQRPEAEPVKVRHQVQVARKIDACGAAPGCARVCVAGGRP